MKTVIKIIKIIVLFLWFPPVVSAVTCVSEECYQSSLPSGGTIRSATINWVANTGDCPQGGCYTRTLKVSCAVDKVGNVCTPINGEVSKPGITLKLMNGVKQLDGTYKYDYIYNLVKDECCECDCNDPAHDHRCDLSIPADPMHHPDCNCDCDPKCSCDDFDGYSERMKSFCEPLDCFDCDDPGHDDRCDLSIPMHHPDCSCTPKCICDKFMTSAVVGGVHDTDYSQVEVDYCYQYMTSGIDPNPGNKVVCSFCDEDDPACDLYKDDCEPYSWVISDCWAHYGSLLRSYVEIRTDRGDRFSVGTKPSEDEIVSGAFMDCSGLIIESGDQRNVCDAFRDFEEFPEYQKDDDEIDEDNDGEFEKGEDGISGDDAENLKKVVDNTNKINDGVERLGDYLDEINDNLVDIKTILQKDEQIDLPDLPNYDVPELDVEIPLDFVVPDEFTEAVDDARSEAQKEYTLDDAPDEFKEKINVEDEFEEFKSREDFEFFFTIFSDSKIDVENISSVIDFPVFGSKVSVDFALWEEQLNIFGNMLLSITSLSCFVMVIRRS